MTVAELREKLAGLPDDMPVLREYDTFFETDVTLYRIPAAVDRLGYCDPLDEPTAPTVDVLLIAPTDARSRGDKAL